MKFTLPETNTGAGSDEFPFGFRPPDRTVSFGEGKCCYKLGDLDKKQPLLPHKVWPSVMWSRFIKWSRGNGNKLWKGDTVDGSEIRPSPVEVGSLSHYLQGFLHPRW